MSYATLDDIRGRQQRRGFPIVIAISGVMTLLGIIIGATELVAFSDEYRAINETFGEDVVIGGVQVGGLNEADRLALLESVYVERPLLLQYGDSPFYMSPQRVGFRLNTDAMQANANAQLGTDFWGGFWSYLWREDRAEIEIPISADYDPADIRRYLEEIAFRYETSNNNTSFDLAGFTFIGAAGGTTLDIDASIPLIERALYQLPDEQRVVELPTVRVEGRQVGFSDLEAALYEYLNARSDIVWNGTDSVVSIFVLNLQTGEEIGINHNMLHAASSTIKVGVLVNFFRHQIADPTNQEKYQMLNAIACSDNGSANSIIDASSGSTAYIDGFFRLNQTFCDAGAVNTQLLSHIFIGPAGEGDVPPNYYTVVAEPACENRNIIQADSTLQPSNQLQTTAADMGTLLMNLYDCAEYGTGLATIMPGEITQNECRQTIELLRATNFRNMSELGLPENVDMAHKVGYAPNPGVNVYTSGDVGIVYSPGGDYVFAFYIWEAGQDTITQNFKWPIFGDLNRIVYNYFNPDAPQSETRIPDIDGAGAYCVLPNTLDGVDLTNIDANRYTPEGIPDPVNGCYAPSEGCIPFDNWGRSN